LGRCDRIIADSAKGTVTANLVDESQAENIRCKYELAGLAEFPRSGETFNQLARKVHASCGTVAANTTDTELVKSWAIFQRQLVN
jgi:hypothetical protein